MHSKLPQKAILRMAEETGDLVENLIAENIHYV